MSDRGTERAVPKLRHSVVYKSQSTHCVVEDNSRLEALGALSRGSEPPGSTDGVHIRQEFLVTLPSVDAEAASLESVTMEDG